VSWTVENRKRTGWVATENWRGMQALFPDAKATRKVSLPKSLEREFDATELLTTLLRGWTETCGCVSAIELSELFGIPVNRIFASLEALEGEGVLLRGRFARIEGDVPSDSLEIEWCHRRLLARIHRR